MTAARGALEMAVLLSTTVAEYREAIEEAIGHIDRLAVMKHKMGLEIEAAEDTTGSSQTTAA
jgi:hypothetical protein